MTLLQGCVLGVFVKCLVYHRNVHKLVLLEAVAEHL